MKKNNKLSVIYILSSITLFLTLLIGGGYGIYISVGLNFVKSTMSNVSNIESGGISNVSFGGNINYRPSMTGVIILSVILVLISIFDLIVLIKQIVFFKQYKLIQESNFEKKIEKKVKSKSSVIFFTILIDLISIVAGIVGIFINNNCFVRGNSVTWVLYLIDALVTILALISLILLIIKIKKRKAEFNNHNDNVSKKEKTQNIQNNDKKQLNIDKIEYDLLKLKTMKSAKIINDLEYKNLRKKILSQSQENSLANYKTDY